jgi:hypothetical protein
MRINLTTGEFTEVTITSGTLQNISPQAPVEVASTATKNTGIVLPPYAMLSYSDNATVYARNAWDDDSTCVIAVEPFKKAGEGGEYVLPVATAAKLGGVKVGSNLSIDAGGVLSATGGGAINYSTEEQRIGTWIDGKPLYQKTFVETTPSSANVDSEIISLSSDVEFVHNIIGYVKTVSASVPINFSYASNDYVNVYYASSANTIQIKQSSYNSFPCYITIQYTKTTD